MAVRRRKRQKRGRTVRWTLGVLLPLVALVVLEFGYRAVFFIEHRWDPPAPGFDLYGIGGSSTAGEPYERVLDLPTLVAHALGWKVAGEPIRLRLLAKQGSSLYPQLVDFRHQIVGRDTDRPGAVIVYSGHNEKLADEYGPPEWGERARIWLETRLGPRSLLLASLLVRMRQGRLGSPRTQLAHYEAALREVVAEARAAGLVPILATVIGNRTGPEPQLSFSDEDGLVARLDALESAGEDEETETLLRERIERSENQRPYAQWRLARLLQRRGDVAAAREAYAAAHRDRNSYTYYRCASEEQNAIVRRVAEELNCPLVDAVARFTARSPDGLVGWNLFADGHHPNLDGYAILANGFAERIAAAFDSPRPVVFESREDILARVHLSPEDWSGVHYGVGRWLLFSSFGSAGQHERLRQAGARFSAALALTPDYPAPWFGLAIVEACRRGFRPNESPASERIAPLVDGHVEALPCPVEAEAGLALLAPYATLETLAGARRACEVQWARSEAAGDTISGQP